MYVCMYVCMYRYIYIYIYKAAERQVDKGKQPDKQLSRVSKYLQTCASSVLERRCTTVNAECTHH